ncbi:hypothetical protein [Halomonas denitrificans]|nr:hypothetical protein [Halomonas denitrificans]
MDSKLSLMRRTIIRVVFVLTVLALGPSVWGDLFALVPDRDPIEGVAMAFWGVLTLLAAIGIVYPERMAWVLAVQLSYKLVWLLFVGWPLWQSGALSGAAQELAVANLVGVAVDAIAIPWANWFRSLPKRPSW